MKNISIIFTTGALGGLERRIITTTKSFEPNYILFSEPSAEFNSIINPNTLNSFNFVAPKVLRSFPGAIHIFNIICLFVHFSLRQDCSGVGKFNKFEQKIFGSPFARFFRGDILQWKTTLVLLWNFNFVSSCLIFSPLDALTNHVWAPTCGLNASILGRTNSSIALQ